MPITFRCSNCTQILKIPDAKAGSKGKCPKCGAVLLAPAAKEEAEAPARPAARKSPPPEPAIIEEKALPSRSRPAAASDDDNDVLEEIVPRPRSVRKKKNRKTSPLLLWGVIGGTVGLLLFCSGLGVVGWWYFWPKSIDDDLKYMPSYCQMIASARMDQLMQSEAFQELRREIPEITEKINGDKNKSLGLSMDDVDRIVFGNGTGANDSIFVLHTKKAIDAAQLRSQNPNVTYSERKVGKYLLQEPQNASTEAFCVLDKKRLVIGEKKALEAVLMRDKNPEFTNNLQEAIKQLDFSKTIAFAADAQSGRSAIGGGLGRFGPQNNIFGTLGKTRAIVAQAKIDADVRVTITLICEDAASANDVKKMIDGFAVMVRNSKSSPKEINDLLEWNLKVDDNKVTGSNTFKVGPLIKAFKQQQNFALPPGAFQREAGKPGFPNQQPKNPGLPPGARPGKRRPR